MSLNFFFVSNDRILEFKEIESFFGQLRKYNSIDKKFNNTKLIILEFSILFIYQRYK